VLAFGLVTPKAQLGVIEVLADTVAEIRAPDVQPASIRPFDDYVMIPKDESGALELGHKLVNVAAAA
jgi:hypothetical protein